MKRKLLSFLLVLAMALSLATTGAFAAYDDTKGHWAEESIDRWSGHGIVQGSNGSFDPNGSLTRGQMAVILCRLLNLPAAPSAGFTDVDRDAWYADAIDRCAAAGIMLGSGGKAMPNEPISREQSIVMLCRALNIEPVENPDLSRYADADRISDYAKGYVAAMIEAGIINGVTDDSVAPQDEINRASTVTILDRAIIVYADEPGQTVEANGGIVIVAADDVTVTGTAGSIIVAAPEGNVTLNNVTAETVTVTSEGGSVTLNNSTVGSVNVNAEDTTVATTGTTTVDTVNVGESAEGTTVSAGKGTTVSEVANSAEGTTVTGAGKVESVGSDTDVTVETKGTEVENTGNSSISVTDKNGKENNVTSGESSTTTNTTTSSGSSHSHSYAAEWSKDEIYHWHAATCGHSTVSDKAAHNFDAVTNKCTVCGADNTANYAAAIGDTGYATLEDAIYTVTSDATITLLKDVTLSDQITLSSINSFTIDGNGKAVSYNSSVANKAVIRIDGVTSDATITLKNLTLTSTNSGGGDRALSFHNNTGKLVVNVENCELSAGHYAFNVGSGNTNFTANITNSTITGYAAIQTWSANSKITVTNSTLTGNNDWAYNSTGDDDFDTIVVYADATNSELTFNNCIIKANQSRGNKQGFFSLRTIATITCNGCTFNKNGNSVSSFDAAMADGDTYVEPGFAATKESNTKYTVASIFAGGSGTEADPFTISTASQLEAFSAAVANGGTFKDKYIKLTDSITVSDWTPIGQKEQAAKQFAGTFDGNSKTVTVNGIAGGLSADYDGYVGFFGAITKDATVKNLTVAGTISGDNAAGIVARLNGGKVLNCTNQAAVTGTTKAGGVVCLANEDSTIKDCKNEGAVSTGSVAVAGIVAYLNGGSSVTGCENSGAVSATGTYVGGVVGFSSIAKNVTISSCTNSAAITGGQYVGGIIGHAGKSGDQSTNTAAFTISNCGNTGAISTTTDDSGAGGIAGAFSAGTMTGCTNSGAVSAQTSSNNGSAGGIVGRLGSAEEVANCDGGNAEITGRYAGRIIGSYSSTAGNDATVGLSLNERAAGDTVSTIGAMGLYTTNTKLTVTAGTVYGEITAGSTPIITLTLNEGTSWVVDNNTRTGAWVSNGSSTDWTAQTT